MKVPVRWLADYVDIDVSEEGIERLAERLTLAGLEVEEVTKTGTLQGVIVGRVLAVRPHPNADRLQLCDVQVGENEESLEIVCGAPNVVADALVPVALDGAVLAGGFRIEKRKVRGVVSNGMICSKTELGLEDQSDGIWIFEPELGLELGQDLTALLEFDDAIFDFKVASNRPDCASVYGVAREVAAIYDLPLKPLDLSIEETDEPTGGRVAIEIENPSDTPRYAARAFDGVRIGPSPLRIQHRLLKAGMRPRGNVIDATNYVMLELGQPLHPFDAEDIGRTITIRRGRRGEIFRTLDDVDRELSEETLLITDERGAIALAGVMGGERGEIQPTTNRVLLEIASFHSNAVRKSSRAVGLRTEASQRFERGLDPEGVSLAADRTAHWIQKLTGCQVLRGLADAYPTPSEAREIRFRPHRVPDLLGISPSVDEIVGIFRRLDIEATPEGDDIYTKIPFHRPDLQREVDLIEEVGRIYGYDRFPSASPVMALRIGRKDRIERGKDRIRETLVSAGMYEILTDGFDKRDWRVAIGLPNDDLITVRNPMAATQNALRPSLLPGVLGVVESNLSVGVQGGMVFELGRVFSQQEGERDHLAGAFFGRTPRARHGKDSVDLPLARGVLDRLFDALLLEDVAVDSTSIPPYLHPGRSARFVRDGSILGLLGEIAPHLVDRFPTPAQVYLFEFALEPLLNAFETPIRYADVPKHPASRRDLSLTAPSGLPESQIRAAIASEPTLESILLYDLYEGKQVGEGRKSLTYEVAFRHPERTLTDADVHEAAARIEKRLGTLDVHLRS